MRCNIKERVGGQRGSGVVSASAFNYSAFKMGWRSAASARRIDPVVGNTGLETTTYHASMVSAEQMEWGRAISALFWFTHYKPARDVGKCNGSCEWSALDAVEREARVRCTQPVRDLTLAEAVAVFDLRELWQEVRREIVAETPARELRWIQMRLPVEV